MEEKKTYINEDGSMNFRKFDLLTESEQHQEMRRWTEQQQIEYLSREPILSEEETFAPVYELINKYYHD